MITIIGNGISIFDKVICISFYANALGKGMNLCCNLTLGY